MHVSNLSSGGIGYKKSQSCRRNSVKHCHPQKKEERMKTLAFLLLSLVNLIHCQTEMQMIVFTLQGVLEKLEDISDKLKEYEAIEQKQDEINDRLKGYEAIQQKQDEIMDKLIEYEAIEQKQDEINDRLKDVQQKLGIHENRFQELHHELDHVKGLCREIGHCLLGDDLEYLTNVSAEAHHEIKSFHEEMSGIISLAEKDECSEGSLACGQLGICQNTLFSFTCSCPSGFTWDGSDCADVDECTEGKDVCSPNAVCKNSIGSYSCSCNKPFEGDGRTSCEFQCRSRVIDELGCIKRVRESKTFREMTEFCREEGGRQLQKFDLHHLADIKKNFGGGWVGVYDGKWTSDGSLVPEDLWLEEYQSDSSRRCGLLWWDSSSSSFRVTQKDCSDKHWGYCQISIKAIVSSNCHENVGRLSHNDLV
ncbi:uncharacterized protein [Palaemon carinicauda]|uniref:uncharacterized protein isoform X2 n=1 Tax=Palaemon carinicauda TaxID=392227 RepID=UPI0035B59940